MSVPKRTGRPRGPAIKNVVAGSYAGTQEIVERVVKESVGPVSWRPVRAAAAMALALEGAGAHHCWMTQAEFEAWYLRFASGKRAHVREVEALVGIGHPRMKRLIAGEAVTKTEALAMAHYAIFGARLPIEAHHAPTFAAWYEAHFAATRTPADTLCVAKAYISDRMRGYGIDHGQRVAREPGVALIRALDWMLRVGPCSPYGVRLGAAYPGQKTET